MAAAVSQPGSEPGQTEVPEPGEGAGILGRQAHAGDLQRGRTRQPPLQEDAKGRLPGPAAGVAERPDGPGPAARSASSWSRGDVQVPSRVTGTRVRFPLSLLQ